MKSDAIGLSARAIHHEPPDSRIAENVGKQSRGAIHGAGFAISHGLRFGIQQLAVDHLSQHQNVVAGRMFALHVAFEPSQGPAQQGRPGPARRPLRQGQFVGVRRATKVGGQLQLALLQHVDAERLALLQQTIR
jgi:hypothetical protein